MKLINMLKKGVIYTIALFTAILAPSCSNDFLDIVPDNVAVIENAFRLRNEAEKYLFTCYSYLPKNGNPQFNIAMLAGDEIWKNELAFESSAFEIAKGNQRISSPYMNVWDGNSYGGGPNNNYGIFNGIRHCNIFIENMNDMSKVPDITETDRERWIGEAEFLKAYYHYYLLRMYGPIPIIEKNVEIDAPQEEVNVKRRPFDECVDYIANLLDQSAEKLPSIITDITTEHGRVTKSVALGVKAQLLLTAASPLFNGNQDYVGFTNKDGQALMNTVFVQEKWKKAADAALAAITEAELSGSELYYFPPSQFALNPKTIVKLSVRQAVTERVNSEVIWANTNSTTLDLQTLSFVPLTNQSGTPAANVTHTVARKILSPPLKIGEIFYSKNGVPTNEDKTLNFTNGTELRSVVASEELDLAKGYTTARMNFDREPRYYADLGFDGGTFYKFDSPTNSDVNTWQIRAKFSDAGGSSAGVYYNVTGQYIKKLVDWRQSGANYNNYGWPELRLAELYLAYAEALNEAEGPTPAVYEYLDKIRLRAGLAGVKESWDNFSNNPLKYTTKIGLRDIIQQERLIELAFEGKRYWDLLRWKTAAAVLNAPITGWNVYGGDNASYYQVNTLYQQRFVAPRDYLFPLSESSLLQNTNLVQNPGW